MTKLVKIQVGSDVDANFALGKTMGFVPGSEQERKFSRLGESLTLYYEVNIKTGEGSLVGMSSRDDIGLKNDGYN